MKVTTNSSQFIRLTENRGTFLVNASLIKSVFPKESTNGYRSTVYTSSGSEYICHETVDEIYKLLNK